ncbi:SirB2 family protein [Shewanella gelidii]|uniref:SirB family protein n=1 Tax=Shewanella gelidii TaxID=1642821 RepID=A0A917JJZ7_9GAMM|nr:SirB2 family protein [Shewanella gelidii]MCL1097080.1 SirB2 family protein [Shewanella gelidii]GGI72419.1 SirB family protein [Shewanella gelidii]
MEFFYSLYPYVKHLHLTLVAISVLFFIVRFVLHMRQAAVMERKVMKIAPHVIDTFMLLSGLTLCFLILQYPFVDAWLTEKIIGVAAYILLGVMAMHPNKNKLYKVFAFFGAMGWIVYIAKIAVFKTAVLIG